MPKVICKRHDDRVVIHFDYDCFYASVFEAEDPSLKHLPLAVQQKQIIVTCNYEARRQGLHKLQLITSAKQVCPDVIIKLGEDLTRFRNASKALYNFLRQFSWCDKVEKLGFDEVFFDVTDLINYNYGILNFHNLESSFFQLSRTDPTVGFQFDARTVVGKTYPPLTGPESFGFVSGSGDQSLLVRLILGSHLSQHMRHAMDEQKGYTATVGISTSKLLSKLVGNCNKPNHQTTLLPPYRSSGDTLGPETNVFRFISDHDIGGLPGIGFSLSQKLRSHVLHRAASSEDGLIYGRSKEKMTVRDMRESPNMSPQLLDKILGGPGAQQGIGGKIWGLLSGVDDTEVAQARNVPRQISIEDSYIRLDTLDQVYKELNMLAASLLKRMQMDLLEDDDDEEESREDQNTATGNRLNITASGNKRWMAHPRVIRLTTRPRKASNPDGTRARSFARISRSGPLPLFIFNLSASIDVTARKLVDECLLSLFKSLHPEKSGWNLSLVNVGVTNMEEGISSATGERDISKMFKRQDEFLRDWKVEDRDIPPDGDAARPEDLDIEDHTAGGQTFSRRDDHVDSEDFSFSTPQSSTAELDMEWDEEDGEQDCCSTCGAVLPGFAMAAHERYHAMEE